MYLPLAEYQIHLHTKVFRSHPQEVYPTHQQNSQKNSPMRANKYSVIHNLTNIPLELVH